MKFSELLRISDNPSRNAEIGFLEVFGDPEADLAQPRYDSRTVEPRDIFFAIRGFQINGHAFINAAIERGAKAIVLDDPQFFSTDEAEQLGVARLLVQNSRRALALISEEYFGKPSTKLRLIGVTGTNGKTTTTTILKQILEANGERVGLIGTIGITIGDRQIAATHTTPESRDISELLYQMVHENVTTCVMEVSSHALALDRVSALDFDIAVFTNLTQDHLDFHLTMEAYFEAKQRLFNELKDVAVAITNSDDPFGERMVDQTVANSHSYGIELSTERGLGHADLFATNVRLSVEGTTVTVQKRYSDERADIETSLVGLFNVENLLAAMSALYFGVEGYSLEVLARLIKQIRPVRGRFETVKLKNGVTAVIDYAHTPDALQNVLETLRSVRAKDSHSKIHTVFGCGGDRDRTKRPQMGAIAAALSDDIYVTSDNPRSEDPLAIIDQIVSGIPDEFTGHTRVIPDRAEAIKEAFQAASEGDVVLIAGKGHETYQIVGTIKNHFDDLEEVLKWQESYGNR